MLCFCWFQNPRGFGVFADFLHSDTLSPHLTCGIVAVAVGLKDADGYFMHVKLNSSETAEPHFDQWDAAQHSLILHTIKPLLDFENDLSANFLVFFLFFHSFWSILPLIWDPYFMSQTVWPPWKLLIKTANEGFRLLDGSSSPSPLNDVSAVSGTVPCRLDFNLNLELDLCAICSQVSTQCSCRQRQRGVPGLPKASCSQNHVFFHEPWLREWKDWSWAERQELCEFQV